MFFGIALVLVLVVPLAVTSIAYEHARRNPTIAPAARRTETVPNRLRWRSDRSAGMTTGVLAAVFVPPLVDVRFNQQDGPPWLRLGVAAALVVVPLALYLVVRPRGQYALGMATGAALVGIVAPLVFLLLFGAVDLVIGWFS